MMPLYNTYYKALILVNVVCVNEYANSCGYNGGAAGGVCISKNNAVAACFYICFETGHRLIFCGTSTIFCVPCAYKALCQSLTKKRFPRFSVSRVILIVIWCH